jgi:hypothetical protein
MTNWDAPSAIAAFYEVIFSLRSGFFNLYQDSSELILHPLIHNGDRVYRYSLSMAMFIEVFPKI